MKWGIVMKRKICSVFLMLTILFVNTGIAFGADLTQENISLTQKDMVKQWDEFTQLYNESLTIGDNQDLPSKEYMEEMEQLVRESIKTGEGIVPSSKLIHEMENQYEKTMIEVRKEICAAELNTDITSRSISNVYTGTIYTFDQADTGNSGEHGDCDENKGNFRHGWGTSGGGYADALSQFTGIHGHTATTWASVGKKIKVHDNGRARIYFNGKYAYFIMGAKTPATYARGTVVAAIYDLTDQEEVARKEIATQSNSFGIPSIKEDTFNKYIDLDLKDGHTYSLKMGVEAYCSGGTGCTADLISSNDTPAYNGDGVDFNYVKVTWR